MNEQNDKVEVFKCDICDNVEFDTFQKLQVHKTHCQKKHTRKERVPFGVPVKRFNAPEEDGHVYRVFNDNWRKEPGRIERARMAGYEMVNHERSGESVGTNEDGSEIKGVLMRIPKELYEEDQAKKQEQLDKIDAQIKGGSLTPVGHKYGNVHQTVKQTG